MDSNSARSMRAARGDASCPTPEELLVRVGRGDQEAFGDLYPVIAGPVLGLARHVVRDAAQAEEVCQEALLEVWRSAARFDPARGGALSWAMTTTRRRAVDRVRPAQASAARDHHSAVQDRQPETDLVSEEVQDRLERERVRRCLKELTPLQRESVFPASYDGGTYRETAERLDTALGTIKTRMRDGLIRLRDCLGAG